jgi:hypothetical protein
VGGEGGSRGEAAEQACLWLCSLQLCCATGACHAASYDCGIACPQAACSGHGALLRCAPPDAR